MSYSIQDAVDLDKEFTQWLTLSSYPTFTDLRLLDLRNLGEVEEISDLCLDIDKVLMDSLNLTLLGLKAESDYYDSLMIESDILRSIIDYFTQLEEVTAKPLCRLATRYLILGLGISNSSSGLFDDVLITCPGESLKASNNQAPQHQTESKTSPLRCQYSQNLLQRLESGHCRTSQWTFRVRSPVRA